MPRPKQQPTARSCAKSQTNRLYWRPNEPHALDTLQDEVHDIDQQLPGHIQRLLDQSQRIHEHLHALLASEHYQEDVTRPFNTADQRATQAITQRFSNRKHLQHLQWFFALLRRKRLLGRLRTIEATLELANGFLAEEETLTQEFLSALQETYTPAAHQHEPPHHKEAPEWRSPRSKEEARLHGIEEPLTPLVSSAEQSRRLLTHFEAQLPELRHHLATSNGWFEVFFVPKRHPKPSIIAYAMALEQEHTQGRPILEEDCTAPAPRGGQIIAQRHLTTGYAQEPAQRNLRHHASRSLRSLPRAPAQNRRGKTSTAPGCLRPALRFLGNSTDTDEHAQNHFHRRRVPSMHQREAMPLPQISTHLLIQYIIFQ